MTIKTLRTQAEQYRAAAQRLFDAGVYVTSKEAAALAGWDRPNGYRNILENEKRGTIQNRGIGTDHLYDAVDVITRWPKGPGAQLFRDRGIDAVYDLVQGLRGEG